MGEPRRKSCPCKSGSNDLDFDPACDPNNPRKITFEDVKAAKERIKDVIKVTPVVKAHMSDLVGLELYMKQDLFQYTGSFKERGARNALLNLSPEQRKLGVVAASAGNHAQALAYHGGLLGMNVTVVMPLAAPINKVEKCKKLKANVINLGDDLTASKREGLRLAREKGYTYINGYDHVDILSGQGTIMMELHEQCPGLDAVVIPVGGGGLIAGCAVASKAINPKTKVIGVIPDNCQSLVLSLAAGKPVTSSVSPSLADGLLVPLIGVNAFVNIKEQVDKVVSVKEQFIAMAMLRLIEQEKIVAEGAGAIVFGALLQGHLNEFKGKKVALIITGGNVDTNILRRCLDRGLAAEGRMVKIKVTLPDKPGQVTQFCQTINSIGVAVKDIFHERAWLFSDVFSVLIKVICETRDHQHSLELKDLLKENYEEVHFVDFPEDYVPPPLF